LDITGLIKERNSICGDTILNMKNSEDTGAKNKRLRNTDGAI
jgi:hypothetical protein